LTPPPSSATLALTNQLLAEQADSVWLMPPPPAFHMLLETVYGPMFSLPKSEDVVNVGSVHAPLPAETGGGVVWVVGVGAGVVGVEVEVGVLGEGAGDVPGAEADGDEGAGAGAEWLAVGVECFVGAAVLAACFPLAAACLGM
jgi:hypothetical protein